MALPFGKLTILVGAGLLGSVLAKEGHMPDVSSLVSGAFKIALKQIRRDDSPAPNKKPRNDLLVAQVNSLREELQMLASSRSITIVTSSGAGARKYSFVIVIVVIGYGYVWWKGWKLPDLMFATRRSLSDARESIAKRLESVYTSIADTKRHFSSKLDGIDHTLDDIRTITESTDSEVSALLDRTDIVNTNVKSFEYAVREMESKIRRIEEKQDPINEGLGRLLKFTCTLENSATSRRNEALPSSSSRPALEQPPATPSRTGSLPAAKSIEPMCTSTSSESHVVQKPLRSTVSGSGLRDFNEISEMGESSVSAASNGTQSVENTNNGSSSSGRFGWISRTSFLTRTRSAATSFKLNTKAGNHQP